jgi:predicted MFS family arabinose efflux permease
LLLGGLLTDWISWRWGLFINVPLGALLLLLAPRYLDETEPQAGRFDLAGAVMSTLGMTALVYGFVRAATDGWGEPGTLASFAAGVALLGVFVVWERRVSHPITPLRLFASRERAGAYAARLLMVGGMYSMFFFLSQYLQGVHGYSPLVTGVAFLPMTAVMFSMVRLVPRLIERIGGTRLLASGVSVALAGMVWLSQLSAGTAFFPGIALPLVLLGVGVGAALAPLTAAGIAGVAPRDAGAASGVMNAAQQLGGSLGLSVLVTVFAASGHVAEGGPIGGAGASPRARTELANAVAGSITGSAVLVALALAVVGLVIRDSALKVADQAARPQPADAPPRLAPSAE